MKEKIKEKFNNFVLSLKKVETARLISVCAALTLLYLASGYCKWIEIAVCALAIGFFAILPLQPSLCLFVYLHAFTMSNIGYNSCFIVTFAGFVAILLVKYIVGAKKGKYLFYQKIVTSLLVFFGVSVFISLFNPLYGGAWMYPCYAILFYCIFAMRDEFNIVQAMNFMFCSLLVSSGLALISHFLPKFQYEVWLVDARFSAFINNPNYLSMRMLFVLSYFMYRYLNNKLSHLGFGLIYFSSAAITVLSRSKAGLICLCLLTLLFLILFLIKDFKKNFKFALIFVALVGLACLICHKFILGAVNRILISFNQENFWQSLLTGRDEIWVLYLNEIFKNPFNALFGKGVLTQQVFVANQFGFTETHNLYIFLLYRFGIVGIIALSYIVYLFIKELNYKKPKLINFIPLMFLAVISLIDNTMKFFNISFFLFAIMILFLDQKEERKI